jgi:serine/threonine protein kinase
MINSAISKYKITRLIGEGGMATVYEAEHEMLGTKVAIKVLNPILSANDQIRERFRNEAKMMASLDHPNITKVIDFDEQPQQLSIIMEFLNGEDLNDMIKRKGALSENEIQNIFTQTLSACQYAHEKGIVHRDIKPSNIFILPNGHVKILDFGIAKLFGQGNEMTQTGTQMGTPIYMSPEQVKADKSIDHRSDIYSLGVTMFYAINGKPPYNAETDSQFDIFTKIVYEPLPEFSVQSNYNELVLRACQKDRQDRFQSCEEWKSKIIDNYNVSEFEPKNLAKTALDFNDSVEIKSAQKTNTYYENGNNSFSLKKRILNYSLIISVIIILISIILILFNGNENDPQFNKNKNTPEKTKSFKNDDFDSLINNSVSEKMKNETLIEKNLENKNTTNKELNQVKKELINIDSKIDKLESEIQKNDKLIIENANHNHEESVLNGKCYKGFCITRGNAAVAESENINLNQKLDNLNKKRFQILSKLKILENK